MRNQQIEGLRGIGVLMVVLFHFLFRFNEIYGDATKYTVISSWGTIGVGLFFAISGYYMFSSSKFDNTCLLAFYKKKLRRLFFPYVIAILVIFCVTSVFGLPERSVTTKEFLCNITFLNGFIGMKYVDSAHWYLTNLILFTFISGIFMRTGLKPVLAIPLWIVFAHVIRFPIGRIAMPGYLSKLLQSLSGGASLYLFFIGVILHEVNKAVQKKDTKMLLILFAYGSLCIVKLLRVYDFTTILGIAAFVGILELCIFEKLPVLSSKWLRSLGAVSYPWYLIHQNIGYVIILSLNKKIPFAVTVLIAVIVTFVLGVILYEIDRFANKEGRVICH